MEEKIEISTGEDSQISRTISSEMKEEKIVRACSSESMPKLNEDSVVYLDDIEEFRFSTTKDEDSPDSTLFSFKSSVQFEKDSFESSYVKITSEEYGSSIKSEKLGMIKTQRACSLSRRKRTRRLVFHDIQIMDIESIKYYVKQPYKKDFQHRQRKQGKNILVEESERRLDQFRGSERAVTYSSRNHRCDQKRSSCSCCSNHKLDTSCSLESPCNFRPEDDVNDCRVMPFRKEKNVIGRDYCKDHLSWNESKGIEDKYSGLQGGQASHFRISKDSVSYLRAAVTMPLDRPKDNAKDDFHRSQSAKHFHPKLPDYDDIKAVDGGFVNNKFRKN
ncbi:hypothetical protein PanWU01x14_132460 [Parasponia andersonii]|uniref:Uncharacterized protein n=1 Tax=Parasponia andersonii TaxID=3476 RepID=A0A2P5CQP6_PARAD|nr:hypothetical protein PanWU01x14_132460 [Parasponia andersonii]